MSVKKVVPLPNTPNELQDYAVKLGLCAEDAQFVEVFSLDEEFAAYVPRPAYSVIFLYPIGPPDGVLETRKKEVVEIPNPVPWFTKQLISNGCGTIAVIHSVVNMAINGIVRVRPGSWFAEFIEKARDKSPDERGQMIYDDDRLYEVHQEAANESTVPIPEECDTHFITFLKIGDTMWELDGRKPQPICHGQVGDLVLAALNVIKTEFMPHVTNQLYISMCAMTAVPKE